MWVWSGLVWARESKSKSELIKIQLSCCERILMSDWLLLRLECFNLLTKEKKGDTQHYALFSSSSHFWRPDWVESSWAGHSRLISSLCHSNQSQLTAGSKFFLIATHNFYPRFHGQQLLSTGDGRAKKFDHLEGHWWTTQLNSTRCCWLSAHPEEFCNFKLGIMVCLFK